jgi:hypothetical protein
VLTPHITLEMSCTKSANLSRKMTCTYSIEILEVGVLDFERPGTYIISRPAQLLERSTIVVEETPYSASLSMQTVKSQFSRS